MNQSIPFVVFEPHARKLRMQPHPLTHVCRQLRTEFASLLAKAIVESTQRCAFILRLDFGPVFEDLRLRPLIHGTTDLFIQLEANNPSDVRADDILRWLRHCQPYGSTHPSGSECYTIFGAQYNIRCTFDAADSHFFDLSHRDMILDKTFHREMSERDLDVVWPWYGSDMGLRILEAIHSWTG